MRLERLNYKEYHTHKKKGAKFMLQHNLKLLINIYDCLKLPILGYILEPAKPSNLQKISTFRPTVSY